MAESLKHLSFLLASPCGAQIGYFSTPRPLRKHLGFQHLTRVRSRVQARRTCSQGAVLARPRIRPGADPRLQRR